jgi:hypothetical protein|tara:strand:- start:788 stop:1012 length:225 start_codon:yes stop_codon:yes gene_type:complete
MKNYAVGIKVYNVFYIGAESEEEAEQKVRELDPYETLKDCDFNIEYVDEYKAGEDCWQIKADEIDWTNHLHFIQ